MKSPADADRPMEANCKSLIQNGSFETPVTDGGSIDSLNVALFKWTPEYQYAVIQHPGIPTGAGPRTETNPLTIHEEFYATPAGNQFVFFGWEKFAKTDQTPAYDGPTSLSQPIAVDTSGVQAFLKRGEYRLRFCQSAMSNHSSGGAWNTIDCRVRVEVALTSTPTSPVCTATFIVPAGQSWTQQSATIQIPDPGQYTLRFITPDQDPTDRVIIDNVKFCKSAQPTTHPCVP